MGSWRVLPSVAAAALVATSLSAAPAVGAIDPLVVDVDPPDTEQEFFEAAGDQPNGWTGSDTNPGSNLDNNNEATEGNYLSALLGLLASDPDRPELIDRIEANEGGLGADDKSVTDFDPGFAWTYAVVKTGNTATFVEDDSDDLLSTGTFENGISHITFFTPLPAAAWMLLTALAGMFGLRFWSRRRAGAAA